MTFKPETGLSPSISDALGEDKTPLENRYLVIIQGAGCFHLLHIQLNSNTFSILLLGFSSANQFL